MLPSLVARDIAAGLRSYIRHEFPIASPGFMTEEGKSVLDAFLDVPNSLTKGPWVEVKLPFRQSTDTSALPFTHLKMDEIFESFIPFEHQRKAFERLAWQTAQSTIVATGTGSGKTECFLLPILDYCLSQKTKGIKAILIYPMNALASDQAKRIAGLISKISQTKLRAGIYTGDTATKTKEMTANSIISDRYELRKNPPDILLTNYKMLDFLLMRPDDQSLWEGNGPSILKYLVVDELHTFDGAQGTDLACLIRRLRDRLHLTDSLACVGTSATIGGPDSIQALCQYATSVFGTDINQESIIVEDRLSPTEYIDSFGDKPTEGLWPSPEIVQINEESTSVASYFAQVVPAWFDKTLAFDGTDVTDEAKVSLGEALPHLTGFQKLVRDIHGVTDLDELAQKWDRDIDVFKEREPDPKERLKYIRAVLDSLIALIALARIDQKGRLVPFLNIRSQLWIRTLSRAVATVSRHPKIALAADLKSLTDPLALPIVGCRECNQVGWGTVIKGGAYSANAQARPDLRLFYESWFAEDAHRDTTLLYPITDEKFYEEHRSEAFLLCTTCGKLKSIVSKTWQQLKDEEPADCSCGQHDYVLVWIPKTTHKVERNGTTTEVFHNVCPHCLAEKSLRIFGAASSSLTSATVGHLHASPFSDDNKVIAFSDSVQDAAQRAGFMVARNYLTTCRHALVHYLKDKSKTQAGIPMRQMVKELSGHWIQNMSNLYEGPNQRILGEAAFLSTFIAPDKQWKESWKIFNKAAEGSVEGKDVSSTEALVQTYDQWGYLVNHMRERLVWEALMELSFRSENGRTVVRTESAIATLNHSELKKVASKLVSRFKEKFNLSNDVKRYEWFLLGLLNKLRMAGALDPESIDQAGAKRIGYDFGVFVNKGNSFTAFNSSAVLPAYGKTYRPPTPVSLMPDPSADKNFNVSMLGKKREETWYTQWVNKVLLGNNEELQLGDTTIIGDILKDTLEVLENYELVRGIQREQTSTWVLPVTKWFVTPNVSCWRCKKCGRRYYFASTMTNIATGMPCPSYHCDGQLEFDDNVEVNPVYTSEPVRIHAREHTSLVDGDTRKRIENNFGNTNHPWSVNLLSATPTLEMGIDIGDLSTVMLCSMPPNQANFLQRIGRAGRRDGNAIALTMVDKSNHDQYFWADPKEMLEGEVKTPGVFLRAVSVLERQLVAFALGRWVASQTPRPKLPEKLKMAISNLQANRLDAFPLNFLTWVSEHGEELYAGFVRLFDRDNNKELTEEARQSLRYFVTGDEKGQRLNLVERVRQCLERAAIQREDQVRKRIDLSKRIKELKKRPEDQQTKNEIESLTQQSYALTSFIDRAFDKKELFNFFTDEGLLPNYAFPEEGVLVNSVIIKRRDKDAGTEEGKTLGVDRFEFSRAASQALQELVPNSLFYAKSHILHVDQVHITKDSFEQWRFCSECSYAEKVDPTQEAPSHCPHCGSDLFGDGGRVKTLLRVRELTAHADARHDRIIDDKESRTVTSMARRTLIDVNSKDIETAWQIDDDRFNFGFEFLKRVTVREINFGTREVVSNATPFKVAGEEFPQFGFKICKKCGMVHRKPRVGERLHDFNCPYYEKEPEEGDNPWIDGLFLYREMSSEAIRIRIPVCDMVDEEGAEIGTQSFIAAIQLGLRRHFKGSVDHLAIELQTEPVAESVTGRNRYIVIYDTVPGGSGYLKDLGRLDEHSHKPEVMQAVFKAAFEAVTTCSCTKNPDRDGCYRCVFQYRDFGARNDISRKEAESLLQRIASYKPEQFRIIKSISDIKSLDMSALEKRLVKSLATLPNIQLTSVPTKTGSMLYELVVPVSEAARKDWENATGVNVGDHFTWQLTAQEDFKGTRASRPDFTLRPKSQVLASKFSNLTGHIFTDGWEFHATSLSEDSAKRQSIMNAGHRVWSLTWQDLTKPKQNEENLFAFGDLLCNRNSHHRDQANNTYRMAFAKTAPVSPQAGLTYGQWAQDQHLTKGTTSFQWLIQWILNPFGFEREMREAMRFVALAQDNLKTVNRQDREHYPAPLFEAQTEEQRLWFRSKTTLPFILVWNFIRTPDKNDLVSAAIRIDERKFDVPRITTNETRHQEWASFWQCANALQFLDRAWVCTRGNDTDAGYDTFFEPTDIVEPTNTIDEFLASWQDTVEAFESDPEFFANIKTCADTLMKHKIMGPDDIVDGFGRQTVCDGQGLVWEKSRQIFLFASEDLETPINRIDNDSMLVLSTTQEDWLACLLNELK